MNNNEINNNLNNNSVPNINTDNNTSVTNNVNVVPENSTVTQSPEQIQPVQVEVMPQVETQTVNPVETQTVNPVETPVIPQVQVQQVNPNVETVTPVQNNNNNNNNNSDDDKVNKKVVIFLVLLFILFLFFILFLPNISEFFRNGRNISSNTEVNTGILVCNMEKEEDTRTTSYEYTFNFTNKKIMISSYNTTLESESKSDIKDNNQECEMIKKVAEDINGIDITCTSSDNISTTIQNNNLKTIDTSKLTKFTEAGGMYPEFKYNENPYDVKSRLVKVGYDCTISAK